MLCSFFSYKYFRALASKCILYRTFKSAQEVYLAKMEFKVRFCICNSSLRSFSYIKSFRSLTVFHTSRLKFNIS
uniref:33K n=1 Tax=Siadenovirus sp. TaxID=2671519 RepID=A0A6B9ITM7_9ADEN|nr:33K [Siadenovirus sp.]